MTTDASADQKRDSAPLLPQAAEDAADDRLVARCLRACGAVRKLRSERREISEAFLKEMVAH